LTTTAPPTDLVLGRLMLAFDGVSLAPDAAERLATTPAAGVTLFRFLNSESPAQVRALVERIQAAARRRPAADALPLLIAGDQEGGQLVAIGEGTTPFAGSMALGASGDAGLAERVGRATGTELAAMGVNVCYAPVCDLATNPFNPAIGIRSFGDDPDRVGELVAGFVLGLQAAGVAAALKHFPGLGDVVADTHHGLATLDLERHVLDARELAPFRAGIAAGARLVMSAHLAVPALTGSDDIPATLSPDVMTRLLRDELGFDGVSITDALDMAALAQGPEQVVDVLAAIRAGVDLLLTAPDEEARWRIERGLVHAAARGLVDDAGSRAALDRVASLRAWLGQQGRPDLGLVGCAEHQALATEVATRSTTLVRDDGRLLPLRVHDGDRVAAVMPLPTDQTPADTSSAVPPALADALRARWPAVDEFVVAHAPSDEEIASVAASVADHAVVVVGTTAGLFEPRQAGLVEAILRSASGAVVSVALRTPFDLAAYPGSATHLSTYGILRPSLDALADVLFGVAPAVGRLPAAIPGLYSTGHGLVAS
jgi:beta-N-acetylhexosaminidase